MKRSIFAEIRDRWELPKDFTVCEWADEARILDPMTSAEPGQWRSNRTPYLKGIMDAFNDPKIRSITIMASTQVGKTEGMLNMLGYAIDQDPGPALWVNPTEELAKSFCKQRIQPMIRLSPEISKHLTGSEDDIGRLQITLDRMPLFIAWSNSPAALSSRPIRYVFLDEIDKYPKFSGREADPVKLATERTRTFWNHKIVKCSTPTTKDGYIFNDYQKTDQCQYYVPCPHCSHYQVFIFSQVKWPKDYVHTEMIKHKKLAWYECIQCKGKITDIHKSRMLQKGLWAPFGCEVDRNGQIKGNIAVNTRKGFWINAIYSPWLTFSEIAAEFLDSKDYINDLMNFVNSWLAEVWEENLGKTKPEEIATLALHYPKGIVPLGVKVLTAGVDVQKDHFYITIRGWGYGQESWLILANRVEHWEEVIEIVFNTYYPSETEGIEPFGVRLTGIDTGYRTDEVYEICSYWRDLARPIKGQSHLSGVPFKVSSLERYPKTGQSIPGGLQLWHIDTSYFKDKITRLAKNTKMDNPGGWHLHANPSEEYLKQFCSEHKVILRDKKTARAREEWRPVTTHAATHFFDTEVYATAAAEMLRVFSMQPEGEARVYRPDDSETKPYGRGGWLPKKSNWNKRNG